MKNIRLFIIGSSLMLCVWLGASFANQTQPTVPADSSATSTEVAPLPVPTNTTEGKEQHNQVAEPVARMK